MRRYLVAFIFVLMALMVVAEKKPETIDALKARAEHARPQDQVRLFMEIAQRQLDEARKNYADGDSAQGKAAIDDVATYTEKAANAAVSTGKHLKQTEIDIRKLSKKLEDIRRSVSLEDRPPLEAAAQRLEKVDSQLLDHMFKGKK